MNICEACHHAIIPLIILVYQSNSVFLGRHWDKLLVTLLLLFEKLTLSGIIGSWGLETDGLSSLCVTEATIIAVISADTMTGSHQVTSGHNGLRSVHKTVTRGPPWAPAKREICQRTIFLGALCKIVISANIYRFWTKSVTGLLSS